MHCGMMATRQCLSFRKATFEDVPSTAQGSAWFSDLSPPPRRAHARFDHGTREAVSFLVFQIGLSTANTSSVSRMSTGLCQSDLA